MDDKPVQAVAPAHQAGMGAVPVAGGVAFRVWAPHAKRVHVVGEFNDWTDGTDTLAPEGGGYWSAEVAGAAAGQHYKFALDGPFGDRVRKDSYSHDVDHSNGNSIVVDGAFDWGDDAAFAAPAWHDLVIYEMHVGTFNDTPGGRPGDLRTAIARLDHVVELGANAVQIMPAAEFPGAYPGATTRATCSPSRPTTAACAGSRRS